MKFFFVISWFLLFSVVTISANYQLTLLTTEDINPKNTEIISLANIKVKKLGKNQPPKWIGDVVIFDWHNETVKVEGNLYKKQGGEYRKLAYNLKSTFCNLVETDEVFFPTFAKCHGLPKKCPFPEGAYHCDGMVPDMSKLPPVLESGDYMTEILFIVGNRVITGKRLLYNLQNKVGGRMGL